MVGITTEKSLLPALAIKIAMRNKNKKKQGLINFLSQKGKFKIFMRVGIVLKRQLNR